LKRKGGLASPKEGIESIDLRLEGLWLERSSPKEGIESLTIRLLFEGISVLSSPKEGIERLGIYRNICSSVASPKEGIERGRAKRTTL